MNPSDRKASSGRSGDQYCREMLREIREGHGAFSRFLKIVRALSSKSSGPRTSPNGECKLFPSLLPSLEHPRVSGSARLRQRGRGRTLAWEWVEVLWALFTFYEGGAPAQTEALEALAKHAARAPWTQLHAEYAGSLHQQIQSFCRLKDDSPLSRGNQKLSEFFECLKLSHYNPQIPNPSSSVSQAKYVCPERMSLPEQAGVIDPLDFLKGQQREIFENSAAVIPEDHETRAASKACFKVREADQPAVYRKLLQSGVATLIPAEWGLRDCRGDLITGGLFAVPHKPHSDRIINDRRPLNELERRLVWAKLPHGSMLTQLIVPKGQGLRGSGDDLQNYFYLLRHRPDWLPRNVVGQPFDGGDFVEFGGEAGKRYLLAFTVVAMGDRNAVDIAQQTHLEILQDCGAMQPCEVLSYKAPLPASSTWEGLYIDVHIVIQQFPSRKLRKRIGHSGQCKLRDVDIIERSRAQYAKLRIPTSSSKAFTRESKFVAWGTEVDSASGRVGCPAVKLLQIGFLILEVCSLPVVGKRCLQQLLGLIVHPLMHNRCLMSVLQDTYNHVSSMPKARASRLPSAAREELLVVGLCLPFACANVRRPVSARISATDASLEAGGRAATLTSPPVAQTLYRYAEHRGEHVRLDWAHSCLFPGSTMSQAPEEVETLMADHAWSTTECCSFGHKQHINVQELKMIKRELVAAVHQTTAPLRLVNLADSRVAVGAWSKGRSSSKQLNRILRSCIGWSVCGRKTLHNVWVQSSANPSDYPSRFRPIPSPSAPRPVTRQVFGKQASYVQQRKRNSRIWALALSADAVFGEELSFMPRHPAEPLWTFREVFAGSANLTKHFKSMTDFAMAPPVERMQRGKPSLRHDLLDNDTYAQLLRAASLPRQFWHFAVPSASFSQLQRLNSSTRVPSRPEGSGALRSEVRANELGRRTVELCKALHAAGSFFTIENPSSSLLWRLACFKELLCLQGLQMVQVDLCKYGLTMPDSNGARKLVQKATVFCGTVPGLEALEARCSRDHEHVQVLGGARTPQGWKSRSKLGSAYPNQLCRAYCRMCRRLFM